MDLSNPCHHWLFKWYWDNICERGNRFIRNTGYKGIPGKEWPDSNDFWFCISVIHSGFNSFTDRHHMWSIFTMYWPQIAFYALFGRE